jgi:hypothetical protein
MNDDNEIDGRKEGIGRCTQPCRRPCASFAVERRARERERERDREEREREKRERERERDIERERDREREREKGIDCAWRD